MTIEFQHFPHAGIRTLVPYKPGKSIEELAREMGFSDIIKLASNENPLGCSPKALAAVHNLSKHTAATYPSPVNHNLMAKLANKLNLNEEQIFLSNGSDFIFSMLLYCFALHTEKHIVTHEYAFSTYAIQAHTLNIPVRAAPVDRNWKVNVESLSKLCTPQTGLVFLANPNNPTGLLTSKDEINYLLEHIPLSTLLVIDEAYFEFAASEFGANCIDWLPKHPNLVITRTFSKIYGMAGLRLGYALANPQIISLLLKVQLPFMVNQAAMAAGEAALDDEEFLQKSLANNAAGMVQMRKGLDALNYNYLPSLCNFLTVDCREDASLLYNYLLSRGIIVRPLHAYKMDNYLRITIGTHEQNMRLLSALQDYKKENPAASSQATPF